MRILLPLLTAIILSACDSSIDNVAAFESPRGTRLIVIVTVLQAANDPAPWWTHISVKTPEEERGQLRANVARLEGRGEVAVWWLSESEVEVRVSDEIARLNVLPVQKTVRDVKVTIVPTSSSKA